MDAARAQAPDGVPGELSCEQAGQALRLQARGGLPQEHGRILRAHLARCPDCSAAYRATVEQRARMGRALRGQAEVSGARRPIPVLAPAPIRRTRGRSGPAHPPADPARGRGSWAAGRLRRLRLRTLLLPAFFAWLILQVAGVGSRPARIELLEFRGQVTLAERPVATYERPPLLIRGAWCHTEDRSSAAFRAPGARFELGPWSSVQAEQADPLRVRLLAGGVSWEGSGTVVTALGVVDLESAFGSVRLTGYGLELICDGGRVSYVGPLGERSLAAGERAELTLR